MNTLTPTQSAYSYVPLRGISLRTACWSLAAGLALMLPVSLLVSFLPLPAPDAEMLRVSASRIAPLHSQPWLIALHGLVIAPFWEEFVYRGLILQMLRRYCPLWVAVLVPTFIFAGIHFTFSYQNAVQAALVGLFFAWLAIRSRSLLTNVLCHAGVNLGPLFVWRFPTLSVAFGDRDSTRWRQVVG